MTEDNEENQGPQEPQEEDSAGELQNSKMNPVTEKIIQTSIDEVIGSYVENSKVFNADVLHKLRTEVTELVNQRLGSEDVKAIDIGLDLSGVEQLPFFFRVNVSKEAAEDHVVKE